jgi:hypothetical protein
VFNIPRPIGLATIRQVNSQLAWRMQNMRVIANACRQIELRLCDHLDGVRTNTEQHRRRKSSKELRLARKRSELRLSTMGESRRFEDRIRSEYQDSCAVTIKGGIVMEPVVPLRS